MGLTTKVSLGDRVKDRIDGFTGIATGVTAYINGCRQALVAPEKLTAEGASIAAMWIDEQHLEVLEHGVYEDPFANDAPASVGGPRSATRATR